MKKLNILPVCGSFTSCDPCIYVINNETCRYTVPKPGRIEMNEKLDNTLKLRRNLYDLIINHNNYMCAVLLEMNDDDLSVIHEFIKKCNNYVISNNTLELVEKE